MNAKTTAVTLVANGAPREFSFEHAENILRMPKNGGWHLPEGSKYIYDAEHGLRCRTNKKSDKGQ